MDASEELRAALGRHHAAEDAQGQKRRVLDRQREEFELEEEATRKQLREAADLAVQALADAEIQPEKLPISPPPRGFPGLFTRQQFAIGWTISLGKRDDDLVLCPDGTLVRPQYLPGRPGPSRSPLRTNLYSIIDAQLHKVRLDTPSHLEVQKDYFAEAFGAGPFQGGDRQIKELQSRLVGTKDTVMEILAEILHRVGVKSL